MRKLGLIILIIILVFALIVPGRVTRAQSTTVNITYNCDGTGPATVSIGDTFSATGGLCGSGSGHYYLQLNFDQCVYFQVISITNYSAAEGWGFGTSGCTSPGSGASGPTPITPSSDGFYNVLGINSHTQMTITLKLIAIESVSPGPDPALTNLNEPCPELGNDVAIFTNPTLWGAGLTNPAGESKGLLLTNKRASIQVLLLPDHKYKIKLIYHETVASDPSQFSIQLADSPFMFVPLDGTTASQTFLAPESNYTPDSLDHAIFALASQLYLTGVPVLGRDLIIDYACITDTEPNRLGSTGDDPGGKSQQQCSFVEFQGTGDFIENARRLIGWLWTGLKSLFDCVLRPLLAGIWSAILNNLSALIRFFTQLSAWIVAEAPLVFSWIGDSLGNLWHWLVGLLGNLLQIALNAAAILLNNLGLSGLVNGIISFLQSLPQAFQAVVNIATIVFEIARHLITRLFELVLSIVGLVPIIVQATISGFNNSSSIPFWAPSCSSSNTILSGPCLGFYIIDNTIFDGPIFYIFIMIDGLVAVNVLLWAIERVKKALIA